MSDEAGDDGDALGRQLGKLRVGDAAASDEAKIQKLLEAGGDINAADGSGPNAGHSSAECSHWQLTCCPSVGRLDGATSTARMREEEFHM